jgi:isopenicillin N synthase-like dioxygenase
VQVWSNDQYESAEHRVLVNPAMARFSMPYFFIPAADAVAVVEPPGEELLGGEDDNDPPRYNTCSWGEFFNTKLNGNYRKLDAENLRNEHFRKG